MEKLVRILANFVVNKRGLAVSLVLVTTAALATQLPKMRSDPAPEKLIGSFAGFDASIGEDFRERFGDTSRVLAVLVEADDILAPDALDYQRRLAQTFGASAQVQRVDNLTTVHLPRIAQSEPEEIGLDDLEEEVGLDELEAEGPGEAPMPPPAVLNALITLTAADRELFPGGVQALGSRLKGNVRTEPIFGEGTVTEAQSQELRDALASAPVLESRLYSRDRSVALIALWLAPLEAKDMRAFVDELRAYIVDNPPPEGTKVRISGLPYIRNIIVEQLRTDQLVLIPLTLLVCASILLLTMRWWFGVVMPLVVVACTALMTVGGMALTGQTMNVINNIIPTLLIIIGMSCAVHIIDRYSGMVRRGVEPPEAARRTVRSLTVATFLTSSTTAAGFAANVLSQTQMLRAFGLIAAIGTMLSFLTALLLVPPTMVSIKPPKRKDSGAKAGALDALVLKATSKILRHPKALLAACVALLLGCVFAATRVDVDTALLDQFDPSDEVYQTTRLLESELGGVRPLEIYLTSEEARRFEDPEVIAALDRVGAWATEEYGQGEDSIVLDQMGYAETLRQTLQLLSGDPKVWDRPFKSKAEVHALVTIVGARSPSPLDAWMDDDGRRARYGLRLRDVGARATLAFAEELRTKLHEELDPLGGVHFEFTGEAYDGSLGQSVVVQDVASSLAASLVIIFFLLVLLFRSVRLALVAIPPNLLTLLGTLGYMVARDIPLATSTAIVFSVALGIAVDGSIHIIARFREETGRGLGPYAALVRTVRGTGRAIIISQGSLVCGFAVLMLSEFVPVRRFGELMSVTVGIGLIGTLVLQPVLLLIGGITSKARKGHVDVRERLKEAARAARAATAP